MYSFNKIIKNQSLMLACLMLCLSFSQSAVAKNSAQANEFIKAHKIISKSKGRAYNANHLSGYILHPYLEFEYLKNNKKTANTQALIQFVNQNRNNWMGVEINTLLLKKLAKQKKWHEINRFYLRGKGGTTAHCIGLEAQLRTQINQQLLNEAVKLWTTGNSRPDECNSLFRIIKQQGLITDALTWKRIGLAMKKGKTTLTRQLSKHLRQPALGSLWAKIRKNPTTHLKNKRLRKNTARNREIIAYGIKRIARKDTNSARIKWQQFQRTHSFNAKTKADVDSYIAVRDAKDHIASSVNAFNAIPANLRSKNANKWMARMALRQGDWRSLLSAINHMPASEKMRERWRYWHAQSSKRLGNQNIQGHLQSIAKNASFYGFLAADELNAPYSRLIQPERNWGAHTHRVKNIPEIRRATELFSVGLEKYAKKEWSWAMKKLSKNDQLIAAAYAHKINQPFTAIITVSGTKDWNQAGLRFPLDYKDLVLSSARKHRIAPAWVYGIMRRESAFDPIIKSHANARGLMQVLPSTAKGVARSLGIRHRTSDLYIPKKNVNIGAGYMSQMLKKFDGNIIKATAAYNAGPHRIPRWLPEQTISAPRWFESIPFDETRDYVRAVLSYTTIYDHKLHYKNRRNLRLSQRLKSIGPN